MYFCRFGLHLFHSDESDRPGKIFQDYNWMRIYYVRYQQLIVFIEILFAVSRHTHIQVFRFFFFFSVSLLCLVLYRTKVQLCMSAMKLLFVCIIFINIYYDYELEHVWKCCSALFCSVHIL